MGNIPGIAHLFRRTLLIPNLNHLLHIASPIGLFQGFDDHRGVHQPGQNAVGPDIFIGVLQGDTLG